MNKRNANMLMRLVASLSLVAGVAIFAVGCGDDGETCEDDEILAEVDGEEDCFATCEEDGDCGDDESCTETEGDQSICTPDDEDNGGDNNDPECEEDGDCEDGVCSEDNECVTCEDEGDCGDSEICTEDNECEEVECVEEGDCGDDEFCTADNECIATTGDASCPDVYDCVVDCSQGDEACQQECLASGTEDAQQSVQALFQCLNETQGDAEECAGELEDCANCGDDEAYVPDMDPLGCFDGCDQDEDCADDESCETSFFSDEEDEVSVCSHDMSSLADSCEESGDCTAPDPDVADDGGASCEETDPVTGSDAEGNWCVAEGCNVPGDQGAGYGPDTGCGLQALCVDYQGSAQLCERLCRVDDDCPRGDTGDYVCSLSAAGVDAYGSCRPACTSDGDCGEGRGCNEDTGVCEYECDFLEDNDADCEDDLNGRCESDLCHLEYTGDGCEEDADCAPNEACEDNECVVQE